MSLNGIEDLLKLLVEVNEVLKDACIRWQSSVHDVELLVDLNPFEVIEPVSWVLHTLDFSTSTSKEESPFGLVNLVVTKQNLCAKQQREQKLMAFEKRSANVLVKCKCLVIIQDLHALRDVLRLLRASH